MDAGSGGEKTKMLTAKGEKLLRERELFITLEKRIFDCVQYDPQEQWDRALDEDGHPRIDRTQWKWFRDYEWRPAQDARNVEEVKKALPGMKITDEDQTRVSGRDGELDDWGQKWSKSNKRGVTKR